MTSRITLYQAGDGQPWPWRAAPIPHIHG